MPTFADALGIHAQAVSLRAERAGILASNLANADTPGYLPRDIDFKAELARELPHAGMLTTHRRHQPDFSTTPGGYALKYRQPAQASLDQNAVDVQAERAEFLDNALRYQASITFLNGRISGLISALRGE